jgi:hypothetical protein
MKPFRAWRFAAGSEGALQTLRDTVAEGKGDDRSKFVRYARASAMWMSWVKEGIVVQNSEPEIYFENGWQYAVVPLSDLKTLQVSRPVDREHEQRMLEATQTYMDPIVAVADDSGQLWVAHGFATFEAALGFQEDMTRPGKQRASDFCFVAIPNEPLRFVSNTVSIAISYAGEKIENLLQMGFEKVGMGTTTHDSTHVVIRLFDETLALKSEGIGESFQVELCAALGLKSLHLNQQVKGISAHASPKNILLRMPGRDINGLKKFAPTFFGDFAVAKVPRSGDIMWNLRDF